MLTKSHAILDKSLGLEKNNAVAWDDKGLAEDALGDHKGATPYYNRAIYTNRTDENAYYNRSLTEGHMGFYRCSREP
jgi:tetratricopeptide (TPR) repeat protein